MIFVVAGSGFSYNTNGTPDIKGTVAAAPHVWTFLQAFYKQFPQYESRDFGKILMSRRHTTYNV